LPISKASRPSACSANRARRPTPWVHRQSPAWDVDELRRPSASGVNDGSANSLSASGSNPISPRGRSRPCAALCLKGQIQVFQLPLGRRGPR
jgi:hypothetical protein